MKGGRNREGRVQWCTSTISPVIYVAPKIMRFAPKSVIRYFDLESSFSLQADCCGAV